MALFEKGKAMNEKNERICDFALCVDNETVSGFSLSNVAERPYNSYAFEW